MVVNGSYITSDAMTYSSTCKRQVKVGHEGIWRRVAVALHSSVCNMSNMLPIIVTVVHRDAGALNIRDILTNTSEGYLDLWWLNIR